MPVTPTSSNRYYGPWQHSNSSLATTPESPVNLTKSPLHDLLEDPEEREDESLDIVNRSRTNDSYGLGDGPLCICKSD